MSKLLGRANDDNIWLLLIWNIITIMINEVNRVLQGRGIEKMEDNSTSADPLLYKNFIPSTRFYLIVRPFWPQEGKKCPLSVKKMLTSLFRYWVTPQQHDYNALNFFGPQPDSIWVSRQRNSANFLPQHF